MQKAQTAYYGDYGGRFVPETLVNVLHSLEAAWTVFQNDEAKQSELQKLYQHYAGRPTPLYFAKNLSQKYGLDIFLKREDLLHTGAHKLNNCLGQVLLTQAMGKKRIIAETGAGQHGVATATVAAMAQMEAVIYMGAVDVERQHSNVKRMELLGAKVIAVHTGSRTLKDAINAALQDWVTNCEDTHYLIGSVVGPHPFPEIVRDFQRVIGDEAYSQMLDQYGQLPDYAIACVGGGSNAAGFFKRFIDSGVSLVGVEAGGISDEAGQHSRTLGLGKPGILHGCRSYLLSDQNGQVMDVHSISAGLDYPSVGPEHSYWNDAQKVRYTSCRDKAAVKACVELSQTEGIVPALESSHALAHVLTEASNLKGKRVLVNLSGRGDKDLDIIFQSMESKGGTL